MGIYAPTWTKIYKYRHKIINEKRQLQYIDTYL